MFDFPPIHSAPPEQGAQIQQLIQHTERAKPDQSPAQKGHTYELDQHTMPKLRLGNVQNELPALAQWHLSRVPFAPPQNVEQKVAWFEGSFNPTHHTHLLMVKSLREMGFKTVIVGTVPLNPHKAASEIMPLPIRVEALKAALRYEGLNVVNSPKLPGVYVTSTPYDFHTQRHYSWFSKNRHILMGPDNFDTYYSQNRPWALFMAKNSIVRYATRFQPLYHNLLAPRILVFDKHFEIHAKDIREGRAEMHPEVQKVLGHMIGAKK